MTPQEAHVDRRILPDEGISFVLSCQERVPCHLAGGAALAGVHLQHRLSADVDLFCHHPMDVRRLVSELGSIAETHGFSLRTQSDEGTHVRAQVAFGDRPFGVDVVFDSVGDLDPPTRTQEGILVESFCDLRAAKLTCLLSRSEPRDLVDLYFLEQAGYPPEEDLLSALRKDTGMDPAVIAWLLNRFPLEPLPMMLKPLRVAELEAYRNTLAERFRAIAVPPHTDAG